jgi:putative ABC transport system permease protein
LVSIFLYGFITVVALIGITNIFNTITTNMELRAPEFAMLKSVGMTNREFRRMIWLEGMFYGGKALLIGIPLGLLISLGFHRALGEGIVTEFRFPWMGVTASCAAVAVLLYLIMHYSMAKINRKNIMDTIRNENI